MENTINVFISYCHKDVTEEWVQNLVTVLGQHGINSIVDIYDLQLGQDLNYFMEQIKKVDKVIILLGKQYMEKSNRREGGVGIETQIISSDVYKNLEQIKFIPVVVSKDEWGNAYLPFYLENRLYIDFSDEELFDKHMEELVKHIFMLPRKPKPNVVNLSKSQEIVEDYLEDLWDLEFTYSICHSNDESGVLKINHLLEVANRFYAEIEESTAITISRKQSLLKRIEEFRNICKKEWNSK